MAGAADSKPAGEPGARPPQRAAGRSRGKVDGHADAPRTGKGRAAGNDTRPRPTVRRWVPVGRVQSVHVYPVKSAGAPPADAITLDAQGAVGDRWFLVTDLEGAVV